MEGYLGGVEKRRLGREVKREGESGGRVEGEGAKDASKGRQGLDLRRMRRWSGSDSQRGDDG